MRIGFEEVRAAVAQVTPTRRRGRIAALTRGLVRVEALPDGAAIGDLVGIETATGTRVGEILELSPDGALVLSDGASEGLRIGQAVSVLGEDCIAPHDSWIGRVIDPMGKPLDGRPLLPGPVRRPLRSAPVNPADRRPMGPRLESGMAVFNTLLPIVHGQRIGLFAGSGVGKSTLLARLATGLEADVVVLALIGERGREVMEFVTRVLGPEGMRRAIVVAATSDRSALMRRRCAWTAMAVAEHFRDAGDHVLYLADSLTRLAEAHREVALAAGEPATLRGFPPSTVQQITRLCERAGPGTNEANDITAVFSVLVAGSDMDEPVADIVRGVLDGHVVLDRTIAERGRFPAVDVLRSVSRSLPHAASGAENALISKARKRLGTYDRVEMMIRAGLYARGSDPEVDAAVQVWPELDAFIGEDAREGTAASFQRLEEILMGESASPVE